MAANLKINQPSEFEYDSHQDGAYEKWLEWLVKWNHYSTLINLEATVQNANNPAIFDPVVAMPRQICLFLHAAGTKINRIHTATPAVDNDTLELVIGRITAHLKPNYSEGHARILFRSIRWDDYEDCNQFYLKLISAARLGCNFGINEGAEIASQLIAACTDLVLKRELLKIAEPTLPVVLAACKQHQAITEQLRGMKQDLVNQVSMRNRGPTPDSDSYSSINAINTRQTTKPRQGVCYRCGGQYPHKSNTKCPAMGHRCKICKNFDHFEVRCTSAKGQNKAKQRSRTRSRSRSRSPSRSKSKQRDRKQRRSRSTSPHQHDRNRREKSTSTQSKSKDGSNSKQRADDYSRSNDSKSTEPGQQVYSSHSKPRTPRSGEVRKKEIRAHRESQELWRRNNNRDPNSSINAIQVNEICSIRDCEIFSRAERELVIRNENKQLVNLNGTYILMLIDSGCGFPIIDEIGYDNIHNKPPLSPTNFTCYGYPGTTKIPMAGEVVLTFYNNPNEPVRKLVYVAKGHGGSLLDTDTAVRLNLIKADWKTPDDDKPGNRYLINNLQQNKILRDIQNEYPEVFSGQVGCLKNFEARLNIDHSIEPVANSYRPVPYHQREPVEKELIRMLDTGIIEPIPSNEPTDWILPMVIVTKENGSLRLCTDGRALKQAIRRTKHPPVTVVDIKHKLSGSKFFSKIDLKNGYYQIKLARESRKYTTFATHMGLFRYRRLNMGISCSSEIFQYEIHRILEGIPHQINISDDILIHAENEAEHDKILKQVLNRLEKYGLTVNPDKCQFKVKELKFFGMIFSEDGIKPDPEKVSAIRNARAPTSSEEIRSFLGIANYVSMHIQDFATKSACLWELTHKDKRFEWTDIHKAAFNDLKEAISTKATAYYNRDWKTILITDASGVGLGAVLIQEDPDNEKNRVIVECTSRLLSKIEKRYSTIEKEALAVVWACEKLNMYLEYCKFQIITDNRAVELIYRNPNSRPPIRIQRWALRLNSYNFTIKHRAGKTNIADFVSRTPTEEAEDDEQLENYVNLITNSNIPATVSKEEIAEATLLDTSLQALIKAITTKNIENITESQLLSQFRGKEHQFSVTGDGLLTTNDKIVIPTSLQAKIISVAHHSHQGETKTYQLLKEKVWFSGMKAKVEEAVKNCKACQIAKEYMIRHPVLMNEIPIEPMDQVAVDFYGPLRENGKFIMVLTDLYSRYPFAVTIKSVAGEYVLPELDKIFKEFGYPRLIRSDNGAPFNGHEWTKYTKAHNMIRELITPYHAQANGLVERFMKNLTTCRRIANVYGQDYQTVIRDYLADYRSTPHSSTGKTPVSLVFNYSCNTSNLPHVRRQQFNHKLQNQIAEFNDHKAKASMKQHKEEKGQFGQQSFKKGEEVRVKLCTKQSKNIPPNTVETFQIKDIHGTQIRAERLNTDNTITTCTRDSSFFKRVHPTNLSVSSTEGADVTLTTQTQENAELLTTRVVEEAQGLIPQEENEAFQREEENQPPILVASPARTVTSPTKPSKRKYVKRHHPARLTPRPVRTHKQPDWLSPKRPKYSHKVSTMEASGDQPGVSGTTKKTSTKGGIKQSNISVKKAIKDTIKRGQAKKTNSKQV